MGRITGSGRSRRRVGRWMIEPLELRTLFAANLHVDSVSIVDGNANPVPNPTIGTYVYLRVDFTTVDLPADASYTMSQTLYGVTYTDTINWGAGYNFAYSWYHYYGGWLVNHSGPATGTVTIDSTNTVAETSESDNTGTSTMFPVQLPLPMKLAQPLGGTAFRDYGYVNYADKDPTSSANVDYRGGPYTYDGHDAIDMTFPSFKSVDDGVPVLAAAAGTVIYSADGNFDRNTYANGDANFVIIDYGNGWQSDYFHLRNGSVGVQVGQKVVQGQVIGLMGSSGYSSGPHLHFSLYNGDAIETYQNPYAYWQNPLPYQGDVDEVLDSGITNYDPTSFLNSQERPPDTVTIKQQPTTIFPRFATFNTPNEPINITVKKPNGTVQLSYDFSAGNYANRGGYYYIYDTLPSVPDLGTWTVNFTVGGVKLASNTFAVTSTGAPLSSVTQGANFIANNRTTPIDSGVIAQGSSATAQVFTVTNIGSAVMTLGSLTAPVGWTIVDPLAASLAAGASDTFSMKPDTAVAGYRYGFASFTTNDPGAPTYKFSLSAEVTPTSSIPVVALISRKTSAAETGLDPGVFRVIRTGGDISQPLTVNLVRSGTATSGSDFQVISTTVTIPAYESSVSVMVTPVDDGSPEPTETVILSLGSSAAYTFAPNTSATVTIADNDSAGTASISGTVYLDKNFNTYRDGTETPAVGVQLFLDANADNIWQASEPLVTSGAGGTYTFSLLPAGRYTVRELTTSGYILSTPPGSTTLVAGQSASGVDVGVFPITFTGTSGNDTFSLAPAATASRILITVNGIVYDALRSQLPSIGFIGLGGNDLLTVDASMFSLAPGLLTAPAITFSGDVGTDTLKLTNSTATDDLAVQAGQLTLGATTLIYTGTESVVIDGVVGAAVSLHSLTLTSARITLAAGHDLTLVLGALVVTGTGVLDVTDNAVIVRGGSLSGLTALAAEGLNVNGAQLWTGNGITSSIAAAEAAPFHAVGVISNTLDGSLLYDTFHGVTVDGADVLIAYTFFGDADLSGTVDDTDYFLTNNGFGLHQSGWINGDFDFSGTVDDTDYFLLNSGYGQQ